MVFSVAYINKLHSRWRMMIDTLTIIQLIGQLLNLLVLLLPLLGGIPLFASHMRVVDLYCYIDLHGCKSYDSCNPCS